MLQEPSAMFVHDENLVKIVSLYIVYAVVALAVYTFGLIVYRVSFHPLAGYPGPFFAKVSDFYSPYHAWKGDRHIDFHRCHERYGPVFRYGPNRLSFNTHTALNTIYSVKANVRKADFYHMLTSPAGPNIVSVVPKDMHARKRRVLSHAFSDKAIKSMEEYMLIHIRSLCGKLVASNTKPIDISKWFTYMTGDILGELCFGKSFGLLEKNENRYVMDLINGSARFALICGCTVQLLNTFVPRLFFSGLFAGRLKYRAFALEQAESRTKVTETDRRDFYHYLMEAKNPLTDEKYSLPELWGESNNIIVAGTDTSALALSGTLFYLTHNEAALEKVKREVRSVFQGKDIEDVKSGPQLDSCRYLRACLDEAMRITPPLPGILPRTVLPGGIEIDGHSLSPGVEVGVAAYAFHHNSSHFPDSFEYRPERFLDEEAETQKYFTPFSTGPRVCIGKNMAYMEMMIVLARVLLLFDFKCVGTLGEGGKWAGEGRKRRGEYQVEDAFICCKSGPLVEFSKA